MKFLFLISSLDRGGAETHLVTLAANFARNGHSVTVFSSGGELAKQLASLGIQHEKAPLNSHAPLSLLRSYFALKKQLRSQAYDLIHAHSRIAAFLVARLAKKCNIPLITTVHARFRVAPLLRRYSRWGTYTIAVSEDLKQYLCEHYACTSERISVIPNGIDLDHFRPSLPPTDERKRLVYLSRLDEDCSEIAFLLCRMAPTLRARYPEIELVIGGGGASLHKLTLLADRINQPYERPLILVVGHCSDPKELYLRADCVLGASRVALEAAACGIPVILGGNEGFLGLLRPEKFSTAALTNFCCRGTRKPNAELLRAAIDEFFSIDSEERNRMVSLISEKIQEHYSIDTVAKQTLSVYRRVCAESLTLRDGGLLFCGYYGDGNTGDHALLRAAIRRSKQEYPELPRSALSAHGRKDEALFGVRCISRWRFFLLLRTIRRAKLLVFGGGTLLQDRTSFRSLCYYVFLLRYAARHGVPAELWGNGLCQPRTRLARFLMYRALCDLRRIGLRDRCSYSLATELCPSERHERIFLESDLAAKTPPADARRILFLLQRYHLLLPDGSIRPFTIIAPRGKEEKGQRHIFLWWLRRQIPHGFSPLFVPLFPKEDALLCEELAIEFGGKLLRGLSERDLVGLMQKSELVASMRLHGLIFAKSAGVPFIGFGDDPKIEAFCREHGGRYWTDVLSE